MNGRLRSALMPGPCITTRPFTAQIRQRFVQNGGWNRTRACPDLFRYVYSKERSVILLLQKADIFGSLVSACVDV